MKINIYVQKYVSDSLGSRKIFILTGSREFVLYFYNHNKNLYNKFEFLENYSIYTF